MKAITLLLGAVAAEIGETCITWKNCDVFECCTWNPNDWSDTDGDAWTCQADGTDTADLVCHTGALWLGGAMATATVVLSLV